MDIGINHTVQKHGDKRVIQKILNEASLRPKILKKKYLSFSVPPSDLL